MHGTATARAGANIALVKYWGKRDPVLNLPATGSLSMTLDGLGTTTTVSFDDALARDEVVLEGQRATGAFRERVSRFLDFVRQEAGISAHARISTRNSVPTAAGLASSASGFAALALAATRAAGLDADLGRLARLARRGSGSAPRSLLGGFVELPAGIEDDGTDCVPVQLAPPDAWDVALVVALAAIGPKEVGSTEGMERTRQTSPFYPVWLARAPSDLRDAREAVADRDLERLGRVAEASCFAMHGAMLGCAPPLLYWTGATVEAVRRVRTLRHDGVPGFVTIDAGPHVKVLCAASVAATFARELARVPGIESVLVERPGPGAEIVE